MAVTKNPCRATYRASHYPGVIQIVAAGTHPTTGYRTWFEPMRAAFHVALYHEAPDAGGTVVTPFAVSTELADPSNEVFKVIVTDADGHHLLDVEPVFDFLSCNLDPGAARQDAGPLPSPGSCGDWYAMLDKMPPKPDRLMVTGVCTFPTSGWNVELRPREVQDAPKTLLLERIVTPPSGPALQVITSLPVRYAQDTNVDYERVHIVNAGVEMPVHVVY